METLNPRIYASLNDIRVVLSYGPLGLVQAVTEQISQNHIQLNTGTITLNHNAEVEIVMSIPGGEHSEHHRIAAQVTHCGDSGSTTLSFRGCTERTMRALLPYLVRH